MIDKKKTVKIFYDNLQSVYKVEGQVVEDNPDEILLFDIKEGLIAIKKSRIIKTVYSEGR